MNDRALIALVAATSIAMVAIGLRVGAGERVRAAVVMGAPLPRGGGRAAWQLRTEEDDGHTRTAVASAFSATIRARGATRELRGVTDVDGVAELAFDAPGLAEGDAIELDVRDGRGAVLARGSAKWPGAMPRPSIAEHQALRPARLDGALRMRVALLDAALAPGAPGRAWVTTTATGEPPRDVRIDATPDLGVEIASGYAASRDPSCQGRGVIELVARGMNGGLALHAKDALGREGDWYGALPVAPGAMLVSAPRVAPAGPVHVAITSASARTLAYVELDDDHGRAAAVALPLTGDPPRGETTFDVATPGRWFLVVSGAPDGATDVAGATRALPLWVGGDAPCESDVAELAARAFPRFVALDGFVAERARLAKRHRRGRLVALLGLTLGSLLETLLLLRAARDSRRRMRRLQNAIIEDGAAELGSAPLAERGPLDILVVLGLSLLGFALLFALVAAFATN